VTNPDLTHLDSAGQARMVDIGNKASTARRAVVEARVRCSAELLKRIEANDVAKGNVIEVARLAGIQAAKRTDELIPLCHSLPLDAVDVRITATAEGLHVVAEASTTWKTGVEMEAFTAATVAALTIIDMGKAVDKAMVIDGVRLVEKTGGKSGDYHAPREERS